MSNPDFPGQYRQDKPEPYDVSGTHRNGGGDGYGRSGGADDGQGAGWPGDWTRQSADASGNGSRRAKHGKSGRSAAGSSSDGMNGGSSGYGADDSGGRRGSRGQHGLAGGGRRSGRRASRAGYVSSEYSDERGRGGNGQGRVGYGQNGSDETGYGRNGYGTASYAAGRDGRYGRGDATRAAYGNGPGSYDGGYGGRTAYLGGTQVADDGYGPLPGEDDWGPGRPSGPGGRRLRIPGGLRPKRSWWRHWTPRKAAALIGCIALGMVLVVIAGFFYIYNRVQLPIQALSQPFVQSTQIYFANGKTLVGTFGNTNRTVLSSQELGRDPYLEQAFFAAEDRHFLTEGGISLTGTARALLVDLLGSGRQGGSTITEQYVKTYFNQAGGTLTWKEKIKEIIDAIKLAKAKPKIWILSHYLNAIYLGNHAYGVEAAAQTYFGKHAYQLDAAQSAMLAAMVQEPSGFDPYHPTANAPGLGYSLLDRWVYVLGNMARDTLPNGKPVLTQQQYQKLIPEPKNPQADLKNFPQVSKAQQSTANWNGFRGYIMNAVARELMAHYNLTYDQISTAGLHITSTFSLPKMRALYAAVHEAKKMMRLDGQALPWYAHIGAILENPKTGAIEASYPGPGYNSKHCKKLNCKWDMAMQSRNQVGSSFKPYVLATAVKQGMNVQTSVLNGYSPLCVPPETEPLVRSKRGPASSCPKDGVGWLPVSYDPVVEGPVSVAKAAALSSNAAFEDLAHRVGTQHIIDQAKAFGVDTSHAYSAAHPHGTGSGLVDDVGKVGIALGIAPLTVEEQATTFATLANGGMYHTPHVIAKITKNGHNVPLKGIEKHRALTPAQAADVDWALSFDTIYGTGVPNAMLSPARPTIGKTGTTDVAQSAFFIGALPGQYSLAFGMFTNSQNNVKGGETLDILPSIGNTGGGYGGAWPATMWRLAMTRLLASGHKPIAQLAPLNLTGTKKWVQVVKSKPKCKQPGQQSGGGGNGNGNGHGHHQGFLPLDGQPKCTNPSPSPSTSPSPGPSFSPSPTPSPPGFTSPPPSPTPSPPGKAKPGNAPIHKSAMGTPSLTISALVPRPAFVRPTWVTATTGLV